MMKLKFQVKLTILIVVLCSIFMVLPMSSNLAYAKSGDAENIRLLQDLGVMNKVSQAFDKPVTRAEFLSFAINMYQMDDISPKNTVFTDVDSTHWASGYIDFAQKSGIVSANDKFYPDNYIKYDEALKMLMSVLGYSEICEMEGGYPSGYFKLANRIGFLKHVDYAVDGEPDYYMVAQLLSNSIETPLIDVLYTGDDYVYCSNDIENTILSRFFDAVKLTGIISGTGDTMLNGESSLKKHQVELYDETENKYYKLLMDDKEAYSYLGKTVDCYVRADDNKVLSIQPSSINKTLTVEAKDIDANNTTKSSLSYYNGERKRHARISPVADMLYNGRFKSGFSTADMLINNGEVSLLDNDNDNIYDVIFVNTYNDVIVVGQLDGVNDVLYDKYSTNSIEVSEDDADYDLQLIKGGRLVSLDEIKEDDIVFCYESRNPGKKLKKLHISNQIVTGVMTQYDSETVSIDGDAYEFSYYFNENRENMVDFKVGEHYKIYIDNNGDLIAISRKSPEVKNYAYLYGVNQKPDLSNLVELKLFNRYGEWIVASCEEKIRLNGTGRKTEDVYGTIKAAEDTLVIYELNEDGNICALEIADQTVSNEDAARDNIFHMHNDTKNVYRKTDVSFDSHTFLNAKTTVIFVPVGSADEELYYIGSTADLASGSAYTYQSYDEDLFKVAGAVLVRYDNNDTKINSALADSSSLLVVSRVIQCLLDGESYYKIYGMEAKKQVEYYAHDYSGVKDLKCGDIIQVLLDGKGIVKYLKVRHVSSDNFIPTSVLPSTLYKSILMLKGNVVRVDKDEKRMVFEEKIHQGINLSSTTLAVYIYDTVSKEVKLGTIADIRMGDYVVIRVNISVAKDIVVIR